MLIKGLYTVEEFRQTGEGITATVRLNKDHDVFKGHFPGNPVMPGVCMIQMVKELTEKSIGKTLFLNVSTNIKFMAIINPEIHPILNVDLNISEVGEQIKVKNSTSFGNTLALKLNATFTVAD